MAQKVDADNAAKERIIKHMNNDHHDSIVRYIQHYGKVASWKVGDCPLHVLSKGC